MELLRQAHQRHRVILGSPLGVTRLRPVENAAREGKRRPSKVRWELRHELAVEETDLQDVEGQMLDLGLVGGVHDGNLKEAIHSRVSDGPTQGLQDVPLHLDEHVIVIKRATHGLELLDCGHTVLLVAILGSDEKGCTSNQLIMSLVHHTLGAVSVQEVDCQEQRCGKKLEGCVCFDQEVQQVWAHEPLDLGLDIDGFHIRKGGSLVTIHQSAPKGTPTSRKTTYFHIQHVRYDVVSQFITGYPGQFIRDGILTFTGDESGVLLGVHPGHTEVIVCLHKKGVTGVVAGSRALVESHDVGSEDKKRSKSSNN